MQILDGVIMVRKVDLDESIRMMACHNIATAVRLARTFYKDLSLRTGKMYVELLRDGKTNYHGGLQLTMQKHVSGIESNLIEFKLLEDGETAGLDVGRINENGTLTILGILREDHAGDVQQSFKESCHAVMKMFATNGELT